MSLNRLFRWLMFFRSNSVFNYMASIFSFCLAVISFRRPFILLTPTLYTMFILFFFFSYWILSLKLSSFIRGCSLISGTGWLLRSGLYSKFVLEYSSDAQAPIERTV